MAFRNRPAHRRRRTVAGLLLAPLILEVCLAVLGYAVLTRFLPSTEAARNTAVAFLRDMEHADYRAGYERLCVRTQQTVTPEQFAAAAREQPRVVRHRVLRTDVRGGRASVEADLTGDGGAIERRVLDLRYEGGTWKICGDPNRVRAPVIR